MYIIRSQYYTQVKEPKFRNLQVYVYVEQERSTIVHQTILTGWDSFPMV
jgi:hypothetical protein